MRIVFVEPRRPCATCPYHLLSLPTPWQCETINEISSCRASLGKTNQSATAAGERCKIAWHKSKSTSKFIEKYVKHAPHDVHAPNSLPISISPLVRVERQKLRRQMQIASKIFSRSRFICFLRRNFKGKLFDMWHYARVDPLGTVKLANRPICIPNYGQEGCSRAETGFDRDSKETQLHCFICRAEEFSFFVKIV